MADINIETGAAGTADGMSNPSYNAVWNGTEWVPALAATDGSSIVQGNVAHDAPDSGNPGKIGGRAFSGTPTAVANGDRVDAWFGLTGALAVAGINGGGRAAIPNVGGYSGDGASVGTNQLVVTPASQLYNGTTWDKQRASLAASYLASAARTATPSVSDITTYNARGIRVHINVTAAADTPSVVFTVEAKDSVGAGWTTLLTSAAITGISLTSLVVMPGITAAANVAAAMALARTLRVLPTHADGSSITYSVSHDLLV